MAFNRREALPPSRLIGKMGEGAGMCEEGMRAMPEEGRQGRNLMPPYLVIYSLGRS